MINLLIQTGAHLVESSSDIASGLCKYVCLCVRVCCVHGHACKSYNMQLYRRLVLCLAKLVPRAVLKCSI